MASVACQTNCETGGEVVNDQNDKQDVVSDAGGLPESTSDSPHAKQGPVDKAIAIAARRVAEFLVVVTVCIVFFMRGPFWRMPSFFRWVMALVAAASLFLIYVAMLGWIGRRKSGEPSDVNVDAVDSIAMRTFRVPQNFGMQTMVMATLAFAILTAMLKSFEVPPLATLAVIGFVTSICGMQMFMNRVPRFASSVVGLVFGLVLAVVYHQILGKFFSNTFQYTLPLGLFFGVFLGLLCGYASGALVAGIFLFIDALVEWWTESARGAQSSASLFSSPVANEPNSADHRSS